MTAKTPKREKAPPPARELWSTNELAHVLGITRQRLFQLNKQQIIPAPVFVPEFSKRFFRVREVQAWINAGMPDVSNWVWQPTLVESLDQLLKRKHREIAAIEQQHRALLAHVERLEQAAALHTGAAPK